MKEKDTVNQTKIYLCRHAATDYTLQNRLQGTLDIPLSLIGRSEAEENVLNISYLQLTRIVTSPQKRAIQTAEIYAAKEGIPVTVDNRLRELDHGEWEGKSVRELLADDSSGYSRWLMNPAATALPSGSETVYEAQKRILDSLTECVSLYAGGKLLIVTHKHIRCLLQCSLEDIDLSNFRDKIVESILPAEIQQSQVQRLTSARQKQTH